MVGALNSIENEENWLGGVEAPAGNDITLTHKEIAEKTNEIPTAQELILRPGLSNCQTLIELFKNCINLYNVLNYVGVT